MANKSNCDLSVEQVESLMKLLKYADEIESEMAYRAARRLVVKTWRAGVIGLAGIIGALVILRANARSLLQWLGS